MRSATPVDRLLLGFLAAVAALAGAFVPGAWSVLAATGTMATCILVTARLRERLPFLDVVHAFIPVPVLALLVNLVGPVVERVNPMRWDAALSRIDAQFFPRLAQAWMNAGGRPDWLVDAASIAYASHYLLPVAAAVVLWANRRREEFDRFTFSIAAVLLGSYAMYFLVPAAGPRVPDGLAQAQLGGGSISAGLRAFLEVSERNELDAFPSGHTAASLVFLAEGWTLFPRTRALLVLAAGAIVFSTVYLSLHYVVDVLGGAALAVLVLAVSPWARVMLGGARSAASLHRRSWPDPVGRATR